MFPFYSPWKHPKTKGFLVFSGALKWEHWTEIGQKYSYIYQKVLAYPSINI